MRRFTPWHVLALAVGYTFLYGPILSLVVYSFNESKLVTVWGGFSTKWYAELLENDKLIGAAKLSLGIACMSATGATILGLMAAIALIRYGRFKGRLLFKSMTTAPLVMPEVITGVSLLLLFVSLEQFIGWPQGRGVVTIVIAHITFATAYATVVIQARLAQMDRSLEEAAADLGARPLRIFLTVTLPLIAPSLAAGWLLAFTLSLDDLVVASFVSGPGSSTLPMVVFSSVRLGVTPQINALATVLIVSVAALVITAGLLARRRTRDGDRQIR